MPSNILIFLSLIALSTSKPIMVTFGTSKGPIVPRQAVPEQETSLRPKTIVARSPAPVIEDREDVPNPSTYKPFIIKTNLRSTTSQRPPASQEKYNFFRKQYTKNLVRDYTGPHYFEKQAYEFEPRRTYVVLPPQYYQNLNNNKYVSQIGVIYRGGVRFYVPWTISSEKPHLDNNEVYDHEY